MKKTKAELTEEKILDTAVSIFAEKGYSATTTSEIAKGAKVAEGTIFRYFPKKKDLLRQVVYKFLEKFGEIVIVSPLESIFENNKDKSVEIILKEIIRNRIELFQKYKGYIRVLITEMQFHDDIYEMFKSRVLDNGIEFAENLFAELRKRGEIREVNSNIALRTLMGSVVFMMLQRNFVEDFKPEIGLEEEIDYLIDIFINGIGVKGRGGE